MEALKLSILVCSIYYSCASHQHHSHRIPVEGYDTGLQDLGQHVEIPETPVKVIKITKTVAVKVPVPYPVKVIQKVPYPVHVNKPYPVPVPQIVHVPAPAYKHNADESNQHGLTDGHSYGSGQEGSFDGGNSGHKSEVAGEYPEEGSYGSSYDAPPQSYYGNNGNQEGKTSFESQSYDQAVQNYLKKLNPSSGGHSSDANSGYYN